MASSIEGINRFLDELKDQFKIKTESELAKFMGIKWSSLYKVRNGYSFFGPSYILSVHEVFDIPIKEIKERVNGR